MLCGAVLCGADVALDMLRTQIAPPDKRRDGVGTFLAGGGDVEAPMVAASPRGLPAAPVGAPKQRRMSITMQLKSYEEANLSILSQLQVRCGHSRW